MHGAFSAIAELLVFFSSPTRIYTPVAVSYELQQQSGLNHSYALTYFTVLTTFALSLIRRDEKTIIIQETVQRPASA